MKTIFIATLLSVGVLLRPEMVPTGNNAQSESGIVTAATLDQTTPHPLDKADLSAAIGGVFSCYGEIDKNGTSVYYTCCANLWILKVCVSVYLGEIPSPLTIL